MSLATALRSARQELGELLERHERARDLTEFERYADDPVGFIRDVLGGDPWRGQVEIAESVRDNPLTAARSANSMGKDWISAGLALWWVYARRGLVLLSGPTERQAREIVMREVSKFWMPSDLPGELYSMALRLGRDESTGILAFTSTEASKLTGFHAPRILAIATEAQAVEDWAYEGLLSCATGEEDRLLVVGNPLAPSGRFYQVCRGDNWHSIQLSAFDHPNLQEDRVVIPGGVTRQFVERMAAEYGTNSGIYQSRVLGEFPDAGEESLFSRDWIRAANDAWRACEFERRDSEAAPVLAVDVARFGSDFTVVCLRQGRHVVGFESWHGADTVESSERVAKLALGQGLYPKYEVAPPSHSGGRGTIVVDEIGIGAGVVDQLTKQRWKVRGFNGGRSPRDGRFRNCRTEAYWSLRKRLEAGEIAFPEDEKLAEELLATNWFVTPGGDVAVEEKDAIKKRLGRSPDKADALSMSCYYTGGPTVVGIKYRIV